MIALLTLALPYAFTGMGAFAVWSIFTSLADGRDARRELCRVVAQLEEADRP